MLKKIFMSMLLLLACISLSFAEYDPMSPFDPYLQADLVYPMNMHFDPIIYAGIPTSEFPVIWNRPPIYENGTALVPLYDFVYSGIDLSYSSMVYEKNTGRITIYNSSRTINANVGQKNFTYLAGESPGIHVGSWDIPPKVVNGEIYVQLRKLAEANGADLRYDEKDRSIHYVHKTLKHLNRGRLTKVVMDGVDISARVPEAFFWDINFIREAFKCSIEYVKYDGNANTDLPFDAVNLKPTADSNSMYSFLYMASCNVIWDNVKYGRYTLDGPVSGFNMKNDKGVIKVDISKVCKFLGYRYYMDFDRGTLYVLSPQMY